MICGYLKYHTQRGIGFFRGCEAYCRCHYIETPLPMKASRKEQIWQIFKTILNKEDKTITEVQ